MDIRAISIIGIVMAVIGLLLSILMPDMLKRMGGLFILTLGAIQIITWRKGRK